MRRVKEESENLAWNSILKKLRSWHPVHHFMANRRVNSRSSNRFYFLGLKNHCRQWLQPWNYNMLVPWKESYDKPRQCIRKQRHSLYRQRFIKSKLWFSCTDVRAGPERRLSTKELMLSNHAAGGLSNHATAEDFWESIGLQGDQTSQSYRKSTLNVHWKDWC